MQTQSTLVAIVNTPNPNPTPTPTPNPTPATDPLKPAHVNPRELAGIVLDTKTPCEPCLFQNVFKGIYIPIKYAMVSNNNKPYERKGLPIQADSALYMHLGISAFGDEKKIYKAPSIPLSIHPERNKTFLENIQFIESKVQEFIAKNLDVLKQQRDQLKLVQSKGKGMRVDPKDKEDPKYVSIIRETTMVDKNGETKTYLNFSCEIHDDDYKQYYCQLNNIDTKNDTKNDKKSIKFDGSGQVPLFLFQSDAYRDGQLQVQRDANNKITNGRPILLQDMVEDKKNNVPGVKEVLAIPTIGFSKLYWNTDKNEIRLRFYLNSCIFIEQAPKKRQRDLGYGITQDDFAVSNKRLRLTSASSSSATSSISASSASSASTSSIASPSATIPSSEPSQQPMDDTGTMADGVDLTNV